jgi:hypothetical protein
LPGALLALLLAAANAIAGSGNALYEQGVTLAGRPLHATRQQGGDIEGRDAACASCHRRSGLGTFEGSIRVPPVAWRILSRSDAEIARERTIPHVLGFHPHRPGYDRLSLARALREGTDAAGRPMSWVMPRYPDLSDADLDALIGHLSTLVEGPPAGADDGQLRFVLVVTPDVDDRTVEAVRQVFDRAFADHNQQIGFGSGAAHGDAAGYDIQRALRLSVWQLQGPATGWPAQLARLNGHEHPFGLLGGLGGGDWSLIDRFCAEQHLPLILPHVDAPDPHAGFYSVHFQRGVALEADVIADELRAHRQGATVPVYQLYRPEDSGAMGAQALREALGPGWPVRDVVVPPGRSFDCPRDAQSSTLRPVAVLWLRPGDLAEVGPAPGCEMLYASGIMAGEAADWPRVWAGRMHVSYPWELPERRRIAMNFPRSWLRAKGQAMVDERAQSDAWLATQVLETALGDLVDAYYPEYLVERIESVVGHRLTNAHYPRLTLAAGQRFASKGAYLLSLQPDGRLAPEGAWRIP